MWPDDPTRTVSHEALSNGIDALPRGGLRCERIAGLRRAQRRRRPRSRGLEQRGQLPDALRIPLRPPEASDRACPGPWEGFCNKGAGNRSARGRCLRAARVL